MPIEGLEDEITTLGERIVSDASDAVMADLMEAAPQGQSGELIASARGPEIEGLSAVVAFDSPHADWTNEGTAPHPIDPVEASALTFFWDKVGAVVSFQHVDHPGQEATHWFDDITDAWDDYVQVAADGA